MGPKSWLALGFLAWLVAIGTIRASAPAGKETGPVVKKSAALQNPAQAGATNVGEDTCATCHGPLKESYSKTPHGRPVDPRSPAGKQGCETCHGPGSKHITDPAANPMKRFNKMSAAEVNATCVTCHNRGEHALWEGSQHESRGLSCVTCHSVHDAKSPEKQLKAKNQMELCATCHRDKVSKLDRSGHMPVREGKMQCTSCHNVHGATNTKLLRTGDSVSELCTSCHAEKRGPYLWEHAPVRDGCTTCHDAHGSPNERMLVSKPPLLCQRCHIATRHPSTIYDAALVKTSVRVFARSCVTCHVAIHGSNHPSGQRFVR
jgi:DmsE family decaheme c-type cytochrome